MMILAYFMERKCEMSLKIVNKAWDIKGLSPTEKLILIRLSDNADEKGICYPSIDYIAENCEVSTKTVTRATARFEKLGYIIKKRRQNQSIVYTLFPDALSVEETKSPIQKNKGHERPVGGDTGVLLDKTQLCPSNLHSNHHLIEEKREEFLDYMCNQTGVKNKLSYRSKLIKNLSLNHEQTIVSFQLFVKSFLEKKDDDNARDSNKMAIDRLNNIKNMYNINSANDLSKMDELSQYPSYLDTVAVNYIKSNGGLRAIQYRITDENNEAYLISQLGGAA